MRISGLAVAAVLVSGANAFAQTPSESSTQSIAVTSFCSQAGVAWDVKLKRVPCSGAWTLTFQPPTGSAAHLVGGMSPIEVRAVLDATGVPYGLLADDSLVVGKARLWFGEQGLEAWGPNGAPEL